MTWGEALRLIKVLRADTTSQFAAAMEGWDFPASRELLATLDLFDLTVMANSDSKKGKPEPHSGRPFKVDGRTRSKKGSVDGWTRDEVEAILHRHARGDES